MDIKKISELPDGVALGGLEEVPIVQAGETVKVLVQDFMDFINGGNVDLQAVLTNGNISNKNIKLTTGAGLEVDGMIKTNAFRLTNGSFYGDLTAPTGNFTANRIIKLPNVNATLVATINGISADANGNVVITSIAPAAHTHPISDITGLQSELDFKADIAHTHTFASLTSKPTTVSGYGITDAVTPSSTHTFTNKSGNISQWTNDAGYITLADVVPSDLQAVTDEGNITTNDIKVNSLYIYDVPSDDYGQIYLSDSAMYFLRYGSVQIMSIDSNASVGYLTVSGNDFSWTITGSPVATDSRSVNLPDASGTIVLSVNGTTADDEGNVVIPIVTPTLQEVTDEGNTTTNDIIINGATLKHETANQLYVFGAGNAGVGNTGASVKAIGDGCAENNSGSAVTAIGYEAAVDNTGDHLFAVGNQTGRSNTGDNLNALGNTAGNANTGDYVNGIGKSAAQSNTGNHVNAFGLSTGYTNSGNDCNFFGNEAGVANSFDGVHIFGSHGTADGNNQLVLSTGTNNVRFDFDALTANRKLVIPDASGTLVVSVNGNAPDAYGNVTVSGGTSLSGTGFVKVTGTTISYDNSTYLTGNQNITITGDATGSGTTSITLTIGAGKVVNSMLAGSIAYNKLTLTSSIVNADIASGAAIDLTKLGTLTTNRALVSDGSGHISASSVTATELGYVSGVTSAIQTQLDAKQAKSIAANSLLVNATGSTANMTTAKYYDVAEQTFTGSIAWTGTTAPSGATNHYYTWSQVGHTVTLIIKLDYATASSSTTAVTFDLPSDCPTPYQWTNGTGGSVISYKGNGTLATSTSTNGTNLVAALRRNSGDTAWEINMATSSGTHRTAFATITYRSV